MGERLNGLLDALRSGAWLTRERVRLVAAAVLAASAIGVLYLVLTADGRIDASGRPLGTDFSNVYAAGTAVLEGRPELPFDPSQQYAREQAIFGPATPFYGWHYPPFFLFVAAALALLPYLPALAFWQLTTFASYLFGIRAILKTAALAATPRSEAAAAILHPLWLLLASAFPAVFINVTHGHNGFLTAALFGTALLILDARPVIAGILIGLLAYKPQFGLLIPVVLIVSGRWRTLAAAAATVALMIVVTTLAFGVDVWSAFLASTRFTRTIVLENGETGWHKIQSIFAWTRMWGGSVALAYAVQGVTSVAVAAALVWLWHIRAAFPLRAAALMIGAILATPYCLDYDLVLLAPALAFLVVHCSDRGFLSYEKTALAALWLVPLAARPIGQAILIPLAVPAMLLVFTLILRRAAWVVPVDEGEKDSAADALRIAP